MRYREISICEARSQSAEQQILLDYQHRAQGLYATYTVIDKVGINPLSGYNTPLGIYCYPLEYIIDLVSNNEKIPYMEGTPYVQIVSPSEFNNNQIRDVLDMLEDMGIEIVDNDPDIQINKVMSL